MVISSVVWFELPPTSQIHLKQLSGRPKLIGLIHRVPSLLTCSSQQPSAYPCGCNEIHIHNTRLFQNQERPFSLIMRCSSVKLVLLCVNGITAPYQLCYMPIIWDTTHDRPIPLQHAHVSAPGCLFPSEQTSVFLIKHLRGCCGLMHR